MVFSVALAMTWCRAAGRGAGPAPVLSAALLADFTSREIMCKPSIATVCSEKAYLSEGRI